MNAAPEMICRALIILTLSLSATFSAGAQIREFDLKTRERLGNALIRASQRSDRGATDSVRKRALQTVRAAVKDRLFEVRYDYVVLQDPDRSGFLVYALAIIDTKRFIQSGGDFRATVSADGETIERIDLLAAFAQQKLEKGKEMAALVASQGTSKLPVETWLYTSHVYRVPVSIVTWDKTFWLIADGKIQKFSEAELEAIEAKAKKK